MVRRMEYDHFEMCADCGKAACSPGCRRSGTPNCHSSLLELGKCLIDEREYVLAISYLERAADRIHPDAYRLLAECYRRGLGVAVDCEKARQYYKSALCQPSFYEPLIAESEKASHIVSSVSPITQVPLSEITCEDLLAQPRYFERGGRIVKVASWLDIVYEIAGLLAQRDPDGLNGFVRESVGGSFVMLETPGAKNAFRLVIDFYMDAKTALDNITKLAAVFERQLSDVRVWMPCSNVLVNTRIAPPKVKPSKGASKKKGKQKLQPRQELKQKGCRAWLGSGSEPRAMAAPVERETYAQKGIGFVVRDRGRFGSLPTYDDMSE